MGWGLTLAFVTSQVWQQRSDARLGFESADLSGSDGLPNADVTAWGEPIHLEFADVATKVAAREIQDGHEFDIAGTAKLRYRKLSQLELPDASSWTPEFGAMRADVVLLSKPSMPIEAMYAVGRWRVTLPAGARLAFQGPLKPHQSGDYRPDWAVNSLVLYAVDGRKLGHLPRPFATDADGKWIWGEWAWSGGILSKRISRAWLDGATYPVTVDATLGYDTKGSSNTNAGTDLRAGFGPWTMSEDGTATSVSLYTGTPTRPITLGIYDDDGAGGDPGTLLRDTAGGTAAANDWTTQALDSNLELSNGDTIWIGQNHDDGNQKIYYDDPDDLHDKWKYESATYVAGVLGDFSSPSTLPDYQVSAYITYTPSGLAEGEIMATLRPTNQPTKQAPAVPVPY
jgi:hypothetical protein